MVIFWMGTVLYCATLPHNGLIVVSIILSICATVPKVLISQVGIRCITLKYVPLPIPT